MTTDEKIKKAADLADAFVTPHLESLAPEGVGATALVAPPRTLPAQDDGDEPTTIPAMLVVYIQAHHPQNGEYKDCLAASQTITVDDLLELFDTDPNLVYDRLDAMWVSLMVQIAHFQIDHVRAPRGS